MVSEVGFAYTHNTTTCICIVTLVIVVRSLWRRFVLYLNYSDVSKTSTQWIQV